MTAHDNKAVVRRFIREIFERGNKKAVDELLRTSTSTTAPA